MNLASILSDGARRHPRRDALQHGTRRVTFGELDRASARIADQLVKDGLRRGDRVGLMLPNVPEFAAAYFGILRAGGIAVPLDVELRATEVAALMHDAQARCLLAWRGLLPPHAAGRPPAVARWSLVPGSFFDVHEAPAGDAAVADRDAGDTAVIVYTSGTTGQPKGAQLTHANLGRNADLMASLFGFGPGDVVLGALPLAHAFGQTCVLNAAIARGANVVLVQRFDAATVLMLLRSAPVTVYAGVPSMYAALLAAAGDEPVRPPSLRLCICGGAPLSVELLQACERALECEVLEGYGLSETSPVASFNQPGHKRRPGSIGTPIAGVEMKVVDDDGEETPAGHAGEIVIRGHNVMKGYWRQPAATRHAISPDGWLRTGDLARVDEDGYFFIAGRKKDLIIRDGQNVYPREVEDVLLRHPDVREAAVLGLPHPMLGEEIVACIALEPGASATEAGLRDYVAQRVAAFKYPRRLWFVHALPKGPTGKILKRAIVVPEAIRAACTRGSELPHGDRLLG